MRCSMCGSEMIDVGYGHWKCNGCNTGVISIKERKYIKQEPHIDDDGIWMPYEEYVPDGCAGNYRLVLTKEMFVEAYNKWIKGE